MNLYDYLDSMGFQIEVTRYAKQAGRWIARFPMCSLKEDSPEGHTLSYIYGTGQSPDDAVVHYIQRIEGKTIEIYSPECGTRQEYQIPEGLTI